MMAGVTTRTQSPDARAEALAGPVVPAMPNLHSHAFQRAIAGRTGRASADRNDSFWSWREAMYASLERLDPDAFEAVAAQAYVEMVKAGYTAVAEFHYVHHDSAGEPFAAEPGGRRRRRAAASVTDHRPRGFPHRRAKTPAPARTQLPLTAQCARPGASRPTACARSSSQR